MSYPVPDNEEKRLSVLRAIGVLYTARDPVFDALCKEVEERFRVPIALISLMDRDRQWFKAECGLGVSGTPRDVAFCNYTILGDGVMVVPDARSDPRFATNPLVTGWPNIVFYAGAPIVFGEGVRLGSLCAIDTVPRSFGPAEVDALAEIADRVAGELWALGFQTERVA